MGVTKITLNWQYCVFHHLAEWKIKSKEKKIHKFTLLPVRVYGEEICSRSICNMFFSNFVFPQHLICAWFMFTALQSLLC